MCNGDVKWLIVKKGGTSISHLLFANDSILFYRAIKEEWGRVKDVLNLYEKGSGQMVNNKKSFIFFNSNTPLEDQTVVIQEIGGESYGNYDKYLALPTIISRSKYNTFR